MNAPVPQIIAAAVPLDDVRWCASLATALSPCCLCVTAERVAEVRALLALPPEQMLPDSWAELAEQARAWAASIRGAGDCSSPTFPGFRQIGLAMRDKVLALPAWAERYP